VPKKVKGLARRSAFNARAEENRVILVDPLKLEAPKTAILRDYLGTIEAKGKVLFLTEGLKENVYLSARNLPDVEVRSFGDESVYDILWATTVIIERGALENAEPPAGAEEKEATDA
jgi:large subunit ribosomal protein L4